MHRYAPISIGAQFELPIEIQTDGWAIYDIRKEFERQGVKADEEKFRIQKWWNTTDTNNICETYPYEVYVPGKISPTEVASWAEFRAKRRFPALSFYYSEKGTSLWRCAQNLPGMMGRRSTDDEYMFKWIGRTNDTQTAVVIYDARSQVKAYSNRLKGGGYENTNYYGNWVINFWSIDNIFGVSKAYQKLFSSVNSQKKIKDNQTLFSTIESSGWYLLIKSILQSVNEITKDMHVNRKWVVVHWSDGWDRTAQLWSLAQILLDPYARTLEGFEVVIEKEWISFGHSFETRWGHLWDDKTRNVKRSPIFIQFLDWVYQLLRQFPTCFQFNVNLLWFLAHHVYSWKFGTFLLDTPKYRHQNKLKDKTVSIWTYINWNADKFLNPFYERFDSRLKAESECITLRLWKEYFLQWTEFSNPLDEYDCFVQSDPRAEMLQKLLKENIRLQKKIERYESIFNWGANKVNGNGHL